MHRRLSSCEPVPLRALALFAGIALGGACTIDEAIHDTTETASEPSSAQVMSADEVFAEGLVDTDWIGSALGFAPGTWTDIGAVDWLPADRMDSRYRAAMLRAAAVADHGGDTGSDTARSRTDRDSSIEGFLYIDAERGRAYRVEMPEAVVRAIAGAVGADEILVGDRDSDPNQARESTQMIARRADDSAPAPGPIDGVSYGLNGPDNRWHVPDTTVAPWTALAAKQPGTAPTVDLCTGTMIGPRTVLTAAHCLIDAGQGNFVQVYNTDEFTWMAGRNRAPTQTPYFRTNIRGMYIPEEYTKPGQTDIWYYSYDYAIAYLTEAPVPMNAMQPPTEVMGKVAFSDGMFVDTSLDHAGYPDCDNPEAPDGCTGSGGGALYHESSCWTFATNENIVDEDGLDTIRRHDCDTSDGHSGGPLYYYRDGTEPTVVGVHVGGVTGVGFVNIFRRMTPTSLALIASWQCLAAPTCI